VCVCVCVCVCACVCVCHREHMCTLTSTSSCVLRVTKEHVVISIGTQTLFGVIFCYWILFLHDLQYSISAVISFSLPSLHVPLLWSLSVFAFYFVIFLLCFYGISMPIGESYFRLLITVEEWNYFPLRAYLCICCLRFLMATTLSLTPSNNYLFVTLFSGFPVTGDVTLSLMK
jgi:hypothetical protein